MSDIRRRIEAVLEDDESRVSNVLSLDASRVTHPSLPTVTSQLMNSAMGDIETRGELCVMMSQLYASVEDDADAQVILLNLASRMALRVETLNAAIVERDRAIVRREDLLRKLMHDGVKAHVQPQTPKTGTKKKMLSPVRMPGLMKRF